MTTHRLRPLAWVTAILSLFVLSIGAAPASAGDRTITRELTFASTFESVDTELTELPGDVVYGWNHLRGKTRWGSRTAVMDFLGDVDYIDGSGPFGGFVTVIHPNGSKLAMRVTGTATSPPGPGTKDATFTGTIRVIGGSGRFAGATGHGTMSGSRTAALGGKVQLVFEVRVTRSA
jgi:hypothetical protein